MDAGERVVDVAGLLNLHLTTVHTIYKNVDVHCTLWLVQPLPEEVPKVRKIQTLKYVLYFYLKCVC